MKTGFLNAVVIPEVFSAATLDNTNIFFRVVRNANVTGGTWDTSSADSPVEYNISATSMTGGEVIETGFIAAGNMGLIIQFPVDFVTQLERYTTTTLADTSDIFTVAIAATQSNKDGFASLTWTEIR